MNKRASKIVLTALSLAVALGAAIGISASANSSAPEIVSKNIKVNGNYALMFAVDPATVAGDDVTLNVYAEAPAEGVKAVQTITKSKTSTEKINLDGEGGAEFDAIVFETYGVSAQDIADVWYITTTSAGVTSEVETYSVREYAFERLYKNGTVFASETDADPTAYYQKQFYLELLDVGSAAQQLLVNYDLEKEGKPTEKLAKEYIYAAVAGGTFTVDGATADRGFVDNKATLTLNSTDASVKAWDVYTFGQNGGLISTQTVAAGDTVTVSGNIAATPYKMGVTAGKYFDEVGNSWYAFNNVIWPFDNINLAHTKLAGITDTTAGYGYGGIKASGDDKYGNVLFMGKEQDIGNSQEIHFPIAAATSENANVIVVEFDFKLITSGTTFNASDIKATEAAMTGVQLQWNKELISGVNGKNISQLTNKHRINVSSIDSDAILDENNVGGDALRFFGTGASDLKKDVWYNVCYELYTDVNKGILYIDGVAVHTFNISEMNIGDVNTFSFHMEWRFRNEVYFDNYYGARISKTYVAP